MLQRSDGEWISSHCDIKALLQHHFASLFTSNGVTDNDLPHNGEEVDFGPVLFGIKQLD